VRILREDGVKHLDSLLFDEDLLVRRAAVQAFVNLFESEEVWARIGHPLSTTVFGIRTSTIHPHID
jgi:hypothetical protein